MKKQLVICLSILFFFTSANGQDSYFTKEQIQQFKIDSVFVLEDDVEYHMAYDEEGNLKVKHVLRPEKDLTHYYTYRDGKIHQVEVWNETTILPFIVEVKKYVYKDGRLMDCQLIKNDKIVFQIKYEYEEKQLVKSSFIRAGKTTSSTRHIYSEKGDLLHSITEEDIPGGQKMRTLISIYNKNGLVDTLKTNSNFSIDYYLYEYDEGQLVSKKGIDKSGELDWYTTYHYYNGSELVLRESEYDKFKGKFKEVNRIDYSYDENGLLEYILFSGRNKKKVKPYRIILFEYEFRE